MFFVIPDLALMSLKQGFVQTQCRLHQTTVPCIPAQRWFLPLSKVTCSPDIFMLPKPGRGRGRGRGGPCISFCLAQVDTSSYFPGICFTVVQRRSRASAVFMGRAGGKCHGALVLRSSISPDISGSSAPLRVSGLYRHSPAPPPLLGPSQRK